MALGRVPLCRRSSAPSGKSTCGSWPRPTAEAQGRELSADRRTRRCCIAVGRREGLIRTPHVITVKSKAYTGVRGFHFTAKIESERKWGKRGVWKHFVV